MDQRPYRKHIHHNTGQPLDTSTTIQLAGAPRLALEMALPTNPTFIHPTRNYALNAPNAVAVPARHDPHCPPPHHTTQELKQCNVVPSPPRASVLDPRIVAH